MFEPLVSVKAPHRQFGVLLWCGEVISAAWGDKLFRERAREFFFLPRSKLFYSLSNNSDNLKNFCGFCLFGCFFQFVQNPSTSVWHSIDELLQSSYLLGIYFPLWIDQVKNSDEFTSPVGARTAAGYFQSSELKWLPQSHALLFHQWSCLQRQT